MATRKISNWLLVKIIEQIILEQQDTAFMKGLLAAEIKLALSQKHKIEVHSNRIARLLKYNIAGVKTMELPTYRAYKGVPINIYRIQR